jgi:hypothetical protein
MMKPKAMKRGGTTKMMRGGMTPAPMPMPMKKGGDVKKAKAMKRGGAVKKK